ncbi:transmembrane 7 superfamily member 3-like [Antedon mediterranea]|uniref:transmembrane 7 superfamily member 3-like n=1 Tax=Antedon mediterranea TaxID=105859 RepID=UPI003AF7BDEA
MKNLCLFTSLFILFKINSCSKINLSIPIDETINVTIEPNVTYLVTVENITTTATFVTIQGHAYRNVSIYGSTTEVPSSDTSMSGSTIGLVSNLQLEQDTVIWYLKNKEVVAIDVLVIVMQYGDGAEFSMPPVPGGCCLTSDLELDPNIKVLQSNYFHTSTEFSQANAGVPRGSDENVCAKSNAPQFRLYYELYIYYLTRFVDRDDYFEGIEKMMTVDRIKENGKKVSSYKGKFQGEVILASIQGQGVIYNVIVTDPLTNHSMAAYVPIVNFACTYTPDYNNQPSCHNILNVGYIAMYIGLSIYGFVLCFLGHYCFKLEVFFFGGLTLGIPAFLIFATSSHLTTAATVTISFVFAGMGGASLYILWWLYGKVLPTMLFVALNLGYLFASCAFFIGPLGNMSVWQDNAAYGLTFTSGMLLIPIFLIPFMHKINVTSFN